MTTLFVLGLVLLVIVNVISNLEAKKQDLQVKFYLRVDASRLEQEEVAMFIETAGHQAWSPNTSMNPGSRRMKTPKGSET